MFQVDAYTYKKIYFYKIGGIIPSYDEYAIKQAEKDGRFKYSTTYEFAFAAYGSTRVEALKAVDRLADYLNIEVVDLKFIDY